MCTQANGTETVEPEPGNEEDDGSERRSGDDEPVAGEESEPGESQDEEPILAGERAPHWPEEDGEGERSRFESIERVRMGGWRSHAGTQTETSQLAEVRRLQGEVRESTNELRRLKNEVWGAKRDAERKREEEVERVAWESEEKLRRRVDWLEGKFLQQLATCRAADREQESNRAAVETQERERKLESALRALADRHEKDTEGLKAQLRERDEHVRQAEARMQAERARREDAEHEAARLAGQMASARREDGGNSSEEIRAELEKERGKRKAQERKVASLENHLQSLKSEHKRMEEALANERERSKGREAELEDEARSLRGQLSQLKSDFSNEVEALHGQKSELERKLESVNSDYNRECQVADILRQRYQEELRRNQRYQEDLRAELERARAQLEDAGRRLRQQGHEFNPILPSPNPSYPPAPLQGEGGTAKEEREEQDGLPTSQPVADELVSARSTPRNRSDSREPERENVLLEKAASAFTSPPVSSGNGPAAKSWRSAAKSVQDRHNLSPRRQPGGNSPSTRGRSTKGRR